MMALVDTSSPGHDSRIHNGDRAISADTALRLARFFGNSAEFWMNLQMHYDLEIANRRSGRQIKRDVQRASAMVA